MPFANHHLRSVSLANATNVNLKYNNLSFFVRGGKARQIRVFETRRYVLMNVSEDTIEIFKLICICSECHRNTFENVSRVIANCTFQNSSAETYT